MTSLADLQNCVARFRYLRVLVVGDVMLDEYVRGTAERLSPEAPVPVLLEERREVSPGGAANVARNVVALGARCSLIGLVGDDPEGRQLTRVAGAVGVSTHGLATDPQRVTTTKTRYMDGRGQQLLRVDCEDTHPARAEVEEKLIDHLDSILRPDALIASDYGKGVLAGFSLRRRCVTSSDLVVLDPHPGHLLGWSGVHYMTPTLSELRRLSGRSDSTTTQQVEAVRSGLQGNATMQEPNPVTIVATDGDAGCEIHTPREYNLVPALDVPRADVQGAGDSFLAAFTLAKAAGAPDEEAALIANAAGGVAVRQSGTAAVSAEQLHSALPEILELLP